MLSTMANATQTISVPADLAYSAELRDATHTFFVAAGANDRMAHQLMLVADELFMNAVKYGSKPKDSISIEFDKSDGEIHFAITDGRASDITPAELQEKIRQHQLNHCAEKTSGRGLAIITKNWTDDYKIEQLENGKLKISFKKLI